ncbi:MAG: Mur ligase [Xanthomonadaceae bacterium]|nr:Mur ligase [Xanthomonadaceae bacterium]
MSAPEPPFEDSRRLTGPNLYFVHPGAALETLGPRARDADAHAAWAERIRAMCAALAWPEPTIAIRAHRSGASLAFSAPDDRLYAATEVDEWAWCTAVDTGDAEGRFHAPGHPAVWDAASAAQTLQRFADAEARPDALALMRAAHACGLPTLFDDDALSIGLGVRGRTWLLDDLPSIEEVPWPALGRIPTALVTGSNGKTTSVRLIAAMLRAHGLRTAHSCTDGLFVGGEDMALERLESGDYSGPSGARQVLRRDDVDAAVLETARGGMLRRGLALTEADVALVTNVSADHFGEYGIHTVEDVAAVKLTVARAVAERGTLVLNADDPLLRSQALSMPAPDFARIAWFHLDASREDETRAEEREAVLVRALEVGVPVCGLIDGRLILRDAGIATDLGDASAMPLSLGGRARYNLSNLAGAALAAHALGVPAETIRATLTRFGTDHGDNPGRLQRWRLGEVEALLDYAHNPEGLSGLLDIARTLRGDHRMALLLGQAGNREDADIRALAATAMRFRPDRIVLKDIEGYMRGRAPGEVAALLRDELHRHGLDDEAITVRLNEVDAVRDALMWARDGDVLVLPVHGYDARDAVAALLDGLRSDGWRPGDPLPVE